MKKLLFFAAVFMSVSVLAPVRAETERNTVRNTINPGGLKNTIEERTNAMIEERNRATGAAQRLREVQENKNQIRQNIVDQIKDKIKSVIPARFHGTLNTIAGTRLIVTTEKGDVTVNVVSDTLLKRRFGANSSLSEFAVGDELAVVAKRVASSSSSPSETSVEARYIRNLSIQRRNTVFSGEITAINSGDNSLTVKTIARGDQAVYTGKDTLITDKSNTIAFGDLKTGDRLIVKGELWDRAAGKIDARRIMRLPSRTALTPTP